MTIQMSSYPGLVYVYVFIPGVDIYVFIPGVDINVIIPGVDIKVFIPGVLMQVDFSSQVGGAPRSRKASSLKKTSGEKEKGVESQ